MQLTNAPGRSALRARLGAAACVLLAAGAPAAARGDAAAPTWQLDTSGLYYGEKGRTQIVEPVAKITRLFAGGQTLSAQLSLDAMTGASPSGAQPSGKLVTTTSASGTTSTHTANEVPTAPFHDFRGALDLGWGQPVGPLTFTSGGHVSRERDYQSLGAHEEVSIDLMHKLATLTFGGGTNRDRVFPIGGIRVGMTDGTLFEPWTSEDKRVDDGLVGLSRVLTRRWMVSLNAARSHEQGYLTEPYKIVSLIQDSGVDAGTPSPDSSLTENRPRTRTRNSVLGSSVWHPGPNVLYSSYRYYWDDWGVRSHTVDLRYRFDLPEQDWLQPHMRYYQQTAADFFTFGLPLSLAPSARPRYASSDFRLGPLRTFTIGATYGFRYPDVPGDITVRAEYIHQWGPGHPASAIGVQKQLDLFPGEDIGTLTAGWTVRF